MRLILDTNVVVSALISRVETAPPRFLLEALADARFESLVSPALLLEWREVAQRPKLRRYLRLDAEGIEFALSRIEQLSDKIDPPPASALAPTRATPTSGRSSPRTQRRCSLPATLRYSTRRSGQTA